MLAGGTGLALQLGHRLSEDFDFFRTDKFNVQRLHPDLKKISSYRTLQEDEHTLTIFMEGVKISFFCVVDPFIFKTVEYPIFFLANIQDIALMKLIAISSRGSRKDFIDLQTILRHGYRLQDLLNLIPKKYGKERGNTYHILKSLTYFDDAEKEPMPRMLEPFNWKECRNNFIRLSHSLVLP
ncbi:MAG: hypothetical protein A3G32_09730 [Deltaproteobacteria bacterium RIFCSPLOWO2_12_FULL_40_28]|nr:MAG: hypothetical protein A3C45_04165 [Deltaproteobacteria bacterium RIFCSPHIGHO2_02_FULL_40_28]OGQ21093.1 MAG: hypothetical protein A3E27_00070 [Deltaproteobacteria bacterium RIFCSPHIGHO2_12_FULL_40_32]OGQ39005.1 MAG: hypothetical protein A3I69_07600 [Deltaproteobacteria bacterium RIFCSPLOWO2_02_FULL_40_36]OGQ53059.1 MAG: hypothetical protein A3G32_09730 [Deltaproteobacteria bacterium RIFCSPLOWO2_12_FULL_40_28]